MSEAEVSNGSHVLRQLPASSRRQQVVDLLRDEIVTGRLVPGEQLKQDVLGRALDVSPGPVREALRQLESEGLVEHFPNRGVFVSDVTREDLLGVLLPVRLAIESFAAVRLGGTQDRAALDELQLRVDAMVEEAARDDLSAVNEHDLAFHEAVVRASGSRHALQLWRSVQPRIRAQIYRLSPKHQAIDEIPREHALLLDAIRGGSEPQIRELMEDHIVGSALGLLEPPDASVS